MRKAKQIIQNLEVTGYAAEGKSLGHQNGKVIFVEGAVPGDMADVLLLKNKKDWADGKAIRFEKFSEDRVKPFCIHFGVCGGCKWQMLPYSKQLEFKQQEAEQNLRRIGKVSLPPILPIIGADNTIYYRNKLEFTFSNKRYLLKEEINNLPKDAPPENALGYHAAGIFDKIIDIKECWLMDEVNNNIRNTLRLYAEDNGLSYYDIKNHTGWLRNVIIRLTSIGELMVNIVIGYSEPDAQKNLSEYLLSQIPRITTLLFTINPKWNDSIYDLAPEIYFGPGFITERLEDIQFKISPKSFFQTNTRQGEKLYAVVRDFAELKGTETAYDLYCGTGSIGLFLHASLQKIIGVDTVAEAIEDAKENAGFNNISHAEFFCGDVINICNSAFFEQHGFPDLVITDPPRAGMHQYLINKLLDIGCKKIIYVSCNVATQARDINLLGEKYVVEKVQPVDMFPHTHHIECIVLLALKQ
ncbi:MAG: 23S rRNA (uracil(1939)-C(5))-methyltransferase RlmD [Ginsengibacter sp.]